jgi:hypothetical protein
VSSDGESAGVTCFCPRPLTHADVRTWPCGARQRSAPPGRLTSVRPRLLATITVVAALALAGCSGSEPRSHGPTTSKTTPTQPSVPVHSHDRNPPSQLQAKSVFTAPPDAVYVLAGSGPRLTDHPALFRSGDGGQHFARVHLPSAHSGAIGAKPFLWLRFVDAEHGYAVLGGVDLNQPTTLMYTTDGARSWHPTTLPRAGGHISAIDGHGGQVFAATIQCRNPQNCPRGSAHIYASALGSKTWRPTAASLPRHDLAGGVGFTAWGDSIWVTLGNGMEPGQVTMMSTDAGATFAPGTTSNGIACYPDATSPQIVWITCSTGMFLAFYRLSGEGNQQKLPIAGAGTGGTFLDPLDDQEAYFGTAIGSHAGLYLTRDGGHTFDRVASLPRLLVRSMKTDQIVFLNTAVGIAPLSGSNLLRTSNGGRSWHTVRFTH